LFAGAPAEDCAFLNPRCGTPRAQRGCRGTDIELTWSACPSPAVLVLEFSMGNSYEPSGCAMTLSNAVAISSERRRPPLAQANSNSARVRRNR